jgi:hypothetical protein
VLACAVLMLREFPADHKLFTAPGTSVALFSLEASWMDEAPAVRVLFR